MAVIELSYNGTDDLNSIIQENLPDWLTAGDPTNSGYIPYRLVASDNEYMEILVAFTGVANTVFRFNIKSGKNGVDTQYTPNEYGNDALGSNRSGVVRIIKNDKTFALTLLSSAYTVRTGAVIAFTGDISDGDFYSIYSPGTHSGTNTSNIYSKIYTMQNTGANIRPPYVEFATETILMPCCDYMHGNVDPISGVFMPIVGESAAPNVLYNGKKKYYKITPNDGNLTIPFYMEE